MIQKFNVCGLYNILHANKNHLFLVLLLQIALNCEDITRLNMNCFLWAKHRKLTNY